MGFNSGFKGLIFMSSVWIIYYYLLGCGRSLHKPRARVWHWSTQSRE